MTTCFNALIGVLNREYIFTADNSLGCADSWVCIAPRCLGGLTARGLFTENVQIEADKITDQLSRGSSLLRNNGDGTFTDVSDAAGVRDAQWGWGVEFLDYDNDGRLDLYSQNGFISGPIEDDL